MGKGGWMPGGHLGQAQPGALSWAITPAAKPAVSSIVCWKRPRI
jgi:hypothetical protein